ncbi:hypothetical protein D3C73_1382050 [compost metagenome]
MICIYIWVGSGNVIVFMTSHRLKTPLGAGRAVSRCGSVGLLQLPCKFIGRTEGRMPQSVNVVLDEGLSSLNSLQNCFKLSIVVRIFL